ncbi:interferon-induced GTP-binding protein Mx3-like [Danio aesculapii]|uniref:interferon-induced GTP-binding protein Mx3-like n=1 Tax=Danio aesculapii TaxID=1142201 RepID=UPI0024C004F9|nr:interferon-induced GTP-binding protein Mx3-like [Danio aesculapii]
MYIFYLHSQLMEGEIHHHLDENIRPYIDLIDNLRSVGVQKDVSLPTIVVIGDQSSGKSSVLEALSGVALPRGSGIITRCPLELRLRKVTGVEWKAVLTYRSKSKADKKGNDVKKFEFKNSSNVEKHITDAQNELAGKGVEICDDLITLEVMSNDVCDLTLIDLPGIVRVPVAGQPEDIGDQIKRLIMKYVQKHETINLVVVPCNVDIATTEALKIAQNVDPEGIRTVAILTKPDLIDKGTEKGILKVVNNKVIHLRKGYTMVKCRGQQQIDERIPLEEALEEEKEFFQNHDIFRCLLSENKATIKCLAGKLTNDLVNHIKNSLPRLDEQVKKLLWNVKNELTECEGGPPQDPKGAKEFLIKTIKKFNSNVTSISSGELMLEENLFAELRGEFRKWNYTLNQKKSRFNNVKELMKKNRGRELHGFFNYKLFETILQNHVAQLKEPAIDLLHKTNGIINKHLTDMVSRCFRNYPVLQNIAKDKAENIQSSQQYKTEERISEQFDMENVIFTQDPLFLKTLNEITNERYSEEELPLIDKKCKYSQMLETYYEIVAQRLTDQLPLMVTNFMLKQTAEMLSIEMLSLVDGANVSELLFEDTEVSRRRTELRARLGRLTDAQEALNKFI